MNKHATASIGPPGLSRLARGLLVLVMVIAALGPAAVAFAAGETLDSDKADYLAGETVTLTGAGFASNTKYDIAVERPDGSFVVYTSPGVLKDCGGVPCTHEKVTGPSFTYSYLLNGIPGRYWARVYPVGTFTEADPELNAIVSATFTDSSNLDQWANGTSTKAAEWQNGNINPQNSTYREADIVPFRMAFEKLNPGIQYTVILKYEFSKQGVEAYDFLATYNVDEAVTLCSEKNAGGWSTLCNTGLGTPDTEVFPLDLTEPGGLTATGLSVDGAVAFSHLTDAQRSLTAWGATIDEITGPIHQAENQYTYAYYTVKFTTANTCTAGDCAALLAWGGHIANSAYWRTTTGGPNGASQIPGASWHVWQVATGGNAEQQKSIQIGDLTAVTLASFNVRSANGRALIEWRTGTELNNAGFNVLRATSAAGPYVKVNAQLIGATGDAVAGASYSFADKPGPGKFYYKLQDVDLGGKTSAHDAAEVTVAWPFLRPAQQPAAPAQ